MKLLKLVQNTQNSINNVENGNLGNYEVDCILMSHKNHKKLNKWHQLITGDDKDIDRLFGYPIDPSSEFGVGMHLQLKKKNKKQS